MIYAQENATQRGDQGTAVAGTVASALKFKAKELLSNLSPNGDRSSETALGTMINGRGLGEPVISKMIGHINGFGGRVTFQRPCDNPFFQPALGLARYRSDAPDDVDDPAIVAGRQLAYRRKHGPSGKRPEFGL
jgi:hypothetical protein